MIISIILIFSFLLDGIVLSIIDMNTLYCPLFTLSSMVIIYPLFLEDKKKYRISYVLFGLFYDICYTNTLFLNVLLFLGITYIIEMIFKKLSINIVNTYLVGMIGILVYRIFHCLFFLIMGFSTWRTSLFFQSIFSSIILNSIYLIIFYFIIKKVRKILKKKKYKLLKVEKLD